MAGEIGKIYQSIVAVMNDLGAISKDKRNQQQGYSFRGIEDMYNALHPLFSKHGIFSVPRVVSRNEEFYENKNGTRMVRVVLAVEYDFVAIDGSSIPVGPIFSEAMDSGDKATNKALSIAHKYALIQLFAIPTEDLEDPDLHSPIIPPAREQKPKAATPAIPEKVEKQLAEKQAMATAAVKSAEPAPGLLNRAELLPLMKKQKWTQEQVLQFISLVYGAPNTKALTDAQYREMMDTIGGLGPAEAIKMAEMVKK